MKRLLLIMLVVFSVGAICDIAAAGLFRKRPVYVFGWRRPDDSKPDDNLPPPLIDAALVTPPPADDKELEEIAAAVVAATPEAESEGNSDRLALILAGISGLAGGGLGLRGLRED